MALNIKNPESERLAKELAARTGESVTAAITTAVRERLDRLNAGSHEERQSRVEKLMEIARDAGARWKEPLRSDQHGDLLYDELGRPQ